MAENAVQSVSCQCGKSWTGYSRCHCGACHETFAGIGLFDAHRRNDKCLEPGSMTDRSGERIAYLTGGLWQGIEHPVERTAPVRSAA